MWIDEGVNDKTDEGVLRLFGLVERIESDRSARRVYVGECTGSRSVGRPQKRWILSVKESLKKRSVDVRQVERMVHDRSVWRRFVRGNA